MESTSNLFVEEDAGKDHSKLVYEAVDHPANPCSEEKGDESVEISKLNEVSMTVIGAVFGATTFSPEIAKENRIKE